MAFSTFVMEVKFIIDRIRNISHLGDHPLSISRGVEKKMVWGVRRSNWDFVGNQKFEIRFCAVGSQKLACLHALSMKGANFEFSKFCEKKTPPPTPPLSKTIIKVVFII